MIFGLLVYQSVLSACSLSVPNVQQMATYTVMTKANYLMAVFVAISLTELMPTSLVCMQLLQTLHQLSMIFGIYYYIKVFSELACSLSVPNVQQMTML